MGHYSFFETILGRLVLLEEDGFLCGLYFEDQGLSYESYTYQKDLAVFEKSEKWLMDYFDGRIPEEGDLRLLMPKHDPCKEPGSLRNARRLSRRRESVENRHFF